MATQAIIPTLLDKFKYTEQTRAERIGAQLAVISSGVVFLSLLAQVAVPLPFTPVPITGQTLGALLVGLAFGRNLGITTLLSYLLVGACGLPVFAGAKAGLAFGPTFGYLMGMALSSFVVGSLADRGWTKTKLGILACCFASSTCVFSCGLLVLSQFVGTEHLLLQGFFPFILGDVIKSLLAVSLIKPVHSLFKI